MGFLLDANVTTCRELRLANGELVTDPPSTGSGICHDDQDCAVCRPITTPDARGAASQLAVCGCPPTATGTMTASR